MRKAVLGCILLCACGITHGQTVNAPEPKPTETVELPWGNGKESLVFVDFFPKAGDQPCDRIRIRWPDYGEPLTASQKSAYTDWIMLPSGQTFSSQEAYQYGLLASRLMRLWIRQLRLDLDFKGGDANELTQAIARSLEVALAAKEMPPLFKRVFGDKQVVKANPFPRSDFLPRFKKFKADGLTDKELTAQAFGSSDRWWMNYEISELKTLEADKDNENGPPILLTPWKSVTLEISWMKNGLPAFLNQELKMFSLKGVVDSRKPTVQAGEDMAALFDSILFVYSPVIWSKMSLHPETGTLLVQGPKVELQRLSEAHAQLRDPMAEISDKLDRLEKRIDELKVK